MKRSLALTAACLALAGNAHAVDAYVFGWSNNSDVDNLLTINETTTRDITSAGSYSSTGAYNTADSMRLGNYIAGLCDNDCLASDYRNFFVVDITGLTAPVMKLTLTLDSFTVSSAGTYTLWDYASSGTIDELKKGGSDWTSIYDDLGAEVTYGSFEYQVADKDTVRILELNESARNDLNAAIANHHSEWAFGGTFEPTAPIPEPETYALMLAGLGVVGWMAKRRRKY